MLTCATAALEAKGMTEETVFFVTADNGSPTPSCGGYQGGQVTMAFNCLPLLELTHILWVSW